MQHLRVEELLLIVDLLLAQSNDGRDTDLVEDLRVILCEQRSEDSDVSAATATSTWTECN